MTNAGKVGINEVRVKMVKERHAFYETNKVKSPRDVANVFHKFFDGIDREQFVVACLNVKNEIVNLSVVSIGSLNSSIVHPREVFKVAVLSNAGSIIVCHNHPSGNTAPSAEDIAVTERLKNCGEMMGISLVDHIILGDDGEFLSLKEKGYI